MRHRPRTPNIFTAAVLGITATVFPTFLSGTAAYAATDATVYVSPAGSDLNTGLLAYRPLKTLQAALNRAVAGNTITLAAGTYNGSVKTVRSGTSAAPITIQGPETGKDPAQRYQAVVTGGGVIVQVNHSYIELHGFTIAGNSGIPASAYPTFLSDVEAFKDANQSKIVTTQLVFVALAATARSLTGIALDDMFLTSSGGQCVGIRNASYANQITNSVIQWCGMLAWKNTGTYRYHAGEGIYIGTSPKAIGQPMYLNDTSSSNVIRGNTILTYGAECLDVKENAHDNVFEGNDCHYNFEPPSSGGSLVELRGDHNSIRDNTIADSLGWNVLLNSDTAEYDRGGNSLQGNVFARAVSAHVRTTATRPGVMCRNTFDNSAPAVVGPLIPAPSAPCP